MNGIPSVERCIQLAIHLRAPEQNGRTCQVSVLDNQQMGS